MIGDRTSSSPRGRGIVSAATFAGTTFAAAALGARASAGGPRSIWYRLLRKPWYQPPPAAFGPVWAALYALIATSGWRVWRSRAPARRRALALWGAQLALNAAWTPIFFRWRRPRAALVDLGLLLPTAGAYVLTVRRADRLAAAMFVPYLAWGTFALALNAAIVRRNPWLRS